MSTTTESNNYFGILNAAGDFWTTNIFKTDAHARQYIIDFWGRDTDSSLKCLGTHEIVPVTIKIIYIEEPSP